MFNYITISWFFFSFKNYLLNSHCGIWVFDYSFPYLLPTKILSPLLSRMTIHYLLLDQCSSPCDIIIAMKILQLSHLIYYDLFYLIYIFVDSCLFCFLSKFYFWKLFKPSVCLSSVYISIWLSIFVNLSISFSDVIFQNVLHSLIMVDCSLSWLHSWYTRTSLNQDPDCPHLF